MPHRLAFNAMLGPKIAGFRFISISALLQSAHLAGFEFQYTFVYYAADFWQIGSSVIIFSYYFHIRFALFHKFSLVLLTTL
jgi:hypothetical protein